MPSVVRVLPKPRRKTKRKLKFYLSRLPRSIRKLKPIEIRAEIKRLSLRRQAEPVGRPQRDAWYLNRDGTLTRWHLIGAVLQEGRTVADHVKLLRLQDLERASPETF